MSVYSSRVIKLQSNKGIHNVMAAIMSTLSKLITLRWRGFWRKQRVKCMMWIVHSFIKQLIVTLLQQFVKFCHSVT